MTSTRSAPPPPAQATLPDAWRVEVFRADPVNDPEAREVLAAAAELGVSGLREVRTGRGFLLPSRVTRAAVEAATRELFADPVLDTARIYAPRAAPEVASGVQRVLVARKSGVMDPVALTVQQALAAAGIVREARDDDFFATTFKIVEIQGRTDARALALLAQKSLANETIEDVLIDDERLVFARPPATPPHGVIHVALVNADEEALMKISRDGALSLSLAEMRAIALFFKEQRREPTVCELETLAQTWSEHCKHKTFTGIVDFDGELIDNLLKRTIKDATLTLAKPWCVSVFHDNAGIIAFDQGHDVCIKVETHNHPSAIDPYGGAGTGVGGVVRDILGVGLGARPIANTDAFFVGPLDLPADKVPKGSMHPRRILRGVVAGVRDYGNRMGIPTVSGGVWVHEGYIGNPLVYAGTVGIMPHWAATKTVASGDAIVVVGGRTGRDGIHGATFSSVELSEESEMVSSAAVQIGDAITEKRVLDGLLTARDKRLYRAITDCGAGGLSSAVGEMSADCGAEVDLEKVPLKYPGLAPEEIWISEAQERMVLSVPPANVKELLATFAAEDVEAVVIGRFTSTGRLVLRHAGVVHADLDLHFLHEGTPRPMRSATWKAPQHKDPGAPRESDHGATLLALLGRPDTQSKEWIVRQYDHEVQGMSVLKPLVGERMDAPGNAAVLKPLATSQKGIAIGCGANPHYGVLDPGAMAEAVIDEALRNVVAVGGDLDHTAILDNFSWGNCEKPDRLGALVLAARGCHRAALAYGTPFISGKDSLNNEYKVGDQTIAIPPTLLITALSVVPDVAEVVSMDAKRAGSRLYLVGATRPELGGSAWFALRGIAGGTVPRPDLATAPGLMRALHRAIRGGHVLAVHDLSEGGLAVAAAEMAFGGGLGIDLALAEVPMAGFDHAHDPDGTRLYSESCSRFLCEVAEGSAAAFERELGANPSACVGEVTARSKLRVSSTDHSILFDVGIEELRRAHLGEFRG
ncbi:MAG: phosphoribosylformylglycinamidine synthase subunit PurL [Planctomycetes bacterium]|nr:phosphoribosylformylglycinamidine synthase subunit PurL [Planctomycetota bacterium]